MAGFCSAVDRNALEMTITSTVSNARQAHNLKVVGSNPTPATNFKEKQALVNQGFFLCPVPKFDVMNQRVIL